MSGLQRVALVLLALCVPVICITTGVRALSLSDAYFRWGQSLQANYDTPTREQREAADVAIARFLAGNRALPLEFQRVGLPETFFSEREVLHMEDVRGILRLVSWLQAVGGVLAVGLLFYLLRNRQATLSAARAIVWGASLTWAIIIFVSGASLLDFQAVFLQFHLLSFSNDMWMLDPARHNLIRMFTFTFFFLSALMVAALAGLQAAILGAAGLLWQRVGAR